MSYELSFSEDFFTGQPDEILDLRKSYPATKRPQCVMQALISIEKFMPAYFRALVREALGYSLTKGQPVDDTLFWELLEKIRAYNTCDTIVAPIDVYVCKDHYVTVYEDIEKEVA
jgi:hypothetical protein